MFWETFRRLCLQADKTPKEAAKDMGIRAATLRKWRQGSMPQERTLRKMADYFGLSISDVMWEVAQDLPDGQSEGFSEE